MKAIAQSVPYLRPSLVYFGQCIQAALMYRSSLLIYLTTQCLMSAGLIAFWYKAAQSNPSQTLYTGFSLPAYFLIASFHNAIQDQMTARDIGSDIRLGKLSHTLIRPYPYLLAACTRGLAFACSRMVLLAPMILLAFWLIPALNDVVRASAAAANIIYYLSALALAVFMAVVTRIAIGLTAFYVSQIWGPDTLFIALYFMTSGALYPIDLAPSWLLTFAKWTPTYYIVGFPTLAILGRLSAAEFSQQMTQGAVVGGLMVFVMAGVWRHGVRKFEAIGI